MGGRSQDGGGDPRPGTVAPQDPDRGRGGGRGLYLLVNTAYLAALTPDEMAGSELVARDAVQGVFGNTAATFVVVASLLILISSGNVNFLGMPRVAFALARAGLAPKVFRYVSPKGTPVAGLLLIGTLILVLASTGALEFLIQFMMLVAISVDLMVLSAFFRLRRTRPDLERPLRVPGGVWTAGLTIVLYLLILGVIVGTQLRLAVGGAVILGGLGVAGVVTAKYSTAPTKR